MWKRVLWQNFLAKKTNSNSIAQSLGKHCVRKKQKRQDAKTLGESSGNRNSKALIDSGDQIQISAKRKRKRKRKDGDTIDESILKNRKKRRRRGLQSVDCSVDHTAQVPESVLHHILSLCTCTKDAARTSILSKRWRRAWLSYSGLEYDEHEFQKHVQSQGNEKTMFRDFVNRSIESSFMETSVVQRLMLNLSSYDSDRASDIDSWIRAAVLFHINELGVRVPVKNNAHYSFPRAVLASNTITTLRLSGCEWKPSSDIRLPNLKRLYVGELHLDEEKLEDIIVSFPTIEDLRLTNCEGLENLHVSSLNLARVEVHQCDGLLKIKLEARYLHTFCYSGKEAMPCEVNLDACKSLKALTLQDPEMTDTLFKNRFSNFPLLENLNLTGCKLLEKVGIAGLHLERLVLKECARLMRVDFDTPSLRSFEYKGKYMSFSSLNLYSLIEAKISFYKYSIGKVRNFLQKFNYSEGLKLVTGDEKDVIIHEDWTEIVLPCTGEINIEIFKSSTTWLELFDSVLRTQPRFMHTVSCDPSKLTKAMEHISAIIGEDHSVCKNKSNTCWRCNLYGAREMKVIKGCFACVRTSPDWLPGKITTVFRLFWPSQHQGNQ